MTLETLYFQDGAVRSLLVIGGARSGKSAFAEAQTRAAAGARVYIATAQAFDDEMRARIDQHRRDRGAGWRTVEEPIDLPEALLEADCEGGVILVDCLTLWLSNLMLAERNVAQHVTTLLATLPGLSAQVALVSNEVGMGLVPETTLGRTFRDSQGRLNQQVAARADAVVFVAAGLPLALKTP